MFVAISCLEGAMNMATQLQNADARAGVRRLVASEVSEALTRQPGLAKGAAANTAQIVAAVAAAVVGLPAAQQKRLKSKSADFADMIAAFARDEMSADRIEIPEPSEVEPLKRSEEHTSELQSLMRISYAVFCLKKKHTSTKKHK